MRKASFKFLVSLLLLLCASFVWALPSGSAPSLSETIDFGWKKLRAGFIGLSKERKATSLITKAKDEAEKLREKLLPVVKRACKGKTGQAALSCGVVTKSLEKINANWEHFVGDVIKLENAEDISLSSLQFRLNVALFESSLQTMTLSSKATRHAAKEYLSLYSAASPYTLSTVNSIKSLAKTHTSTYENWKTFYNGLFRQARDARAYQESFVQTVKEPKDVVIPELNLTKVKKPILSKLRDNFIGKEGENSFDLSVASWIERKLESTMKQIIDQSNRRPSDLVEPMKELKMDWNMVFNSYTLNKRTLVRLGLETLLKLKQDIEYFGEATKRVFRAIKKASTTAANAAMSDITPSMNAVANWIFNWDFFQSRGLPIGANDLPTMFEIDFNEKLLIKYIRLVSFKRQASQRAIKQLALIGKDDSALKGSVNSAGEYANRLLIGLVKVEKALTVDFTNLTTQVLSVKTFQSSFTDPIKVVTHSSSLMKSQLDSIINKIVEKNIFGISVCLDELKELVVVFEGNVEAWRGYYESIVHDNAESTAQGNNSLKESQQEGDAIQHDLAHIATANEPIRRFLFVEEVEDESSDFSEPEVGNYNTDESEDSDVSIDPAWIRRGQELSIQEKENEPEQPIAPEDHEDVTVADTRAESLQQAAPGMHNESAQPELQEEIDIAEEEATRAEVSSSAALRNQILMSIQDASAKFSYQLEIFKSQPLPESNRSDLEPQIYSLADHASKIWVRMHDYASPKLATVSQVQKEEIMAIQEKLYVSSEFAIELYKKQTNYYSREGVLMLFEEIKKQLKVDLKAWKLAVDAM